MKQTKVRLVNMNMNATMDANVWTKIKKKKMKHFFVKTGCKL